MMGGLGGFTNLGSVNQEANTGISKTDMYSSFNSSMHATSKHVPVRRITPDDLPSAYDACDFPYLGALAGVTWNCRSLCGQQSSAKVHFVSKLLAKHDFVVLSETRQSVERELFTEGILSSTVTIYSSFLDTYKGGVCIIVKKSFLERFDKSVKWKVIEKGRLASLTCRGRGGCLQIIAVYLDPSSIAQRTQSIRHLPSLMRQDVHTLIAGDFNFVMIPSDRISKTTGESQLNRGDRSNTATWSEVLFSARLSEFAQPMHTCESSFGWSRIDRVFSNIHPADLATMTSSCHLLSHPRFMSDHSPVSFRVAARRRSKQFVSVPAWTVTHPEYKAELEGEFRFLCESARHDSPDGRISSMQKLSLLKKAAANAARHIRNLCADSIASCTSHRLACTMAFIKFVHDNDLEGAKAMQKKYVKLREVQVAANVKTSAAFIRIKDLAVELMQIDVKERAEGMQKLERSLPREQVQRKQTKIQSSLRRLTPGGSAEIGAVLREDGEIVTEVNAIADALNKHWQETFSGKSTDPVLRREWLQRIRNKFKVDAGALKPSIKDAKDAIDMMSPSASGPDGVPFECYKAARDLAAEVFFEVATSMINGEEIPDESFNHAFMICLPKDHECVNSDGTRVYAPSCTRPISIVDTANRILACIFKLALERAIGHRISTAQKGFLLGRSMLQNVLDIDYAAHTISLKSRTGAILLFDFKAAFPSLAHEMLWDVLEVSGIDPCFVAVIQAFYKRNHHFIKVKGEFFEGIDVCSGVRQGCPLSGILFAICVDVLLEKLADVTKDPEAVCAFADDTAAVIQDYRRSMPILAMLFKQFQQISGLQLNVKKTIFIPLWRVYDLKALKAYLKECSGFWSDILVCDQGKYLGFHIGPGAGNKSFEKPLKKFERAVDYWSSLRMGIFMNTLAFNIYIVTLLEYVAQLQEVTPEVVDKEKAALRKLAPGPGNWIMPTDLEHLKQFGFPAEFRTILITAAAAKLRVCDDVAKDAADKHRALQMLWLESSHRPFSQWHGRSFFTVLHTNVETLRQRGITLDNVHVACSSGASRQRCCDKSISFQKEARSMIQMAWRKYSLENRVRSRLTRWRFIGPEAHVARRVCSNFPVLHEYCRPCVTSSYLRTIFNGWPTSARMRTMQGASPIGQCALGCGGIDRIEHYSMCPHIWAFFRMERPRGLGLPDRLRSLEGFMMAERGMTKVEKVAMAIGVYAACKTIAQARRSELDVVPTRMLRLHAKEAIRGSKACKLLNLGRAT